MNEDPRYAVGERYMPLPCMFLETTNNICKVYSHRPSICKIYPVSFGDNGQITIDVQCEYGRKIYQKTMKLLRELDQQGKFK
jgi:Fe-S-cluster containining protein